MAAGAATLILASKSASRQALLLGAKIPFEAIAADIDERALQASSAETQPERIAALLARAKAQLVSQSHRGRLVLGADQTLSVGDRLFNKAESLDGAFHQLQALSGRTHLLHSAIAVASDDQILFEHVSVARMTMRALTDDEIKNYLDFAGDAILSSVGCYQLEGLGARLFENIEGDHFTILGLPLLPLLDFLRRRQFLSF
jgi:septum formation protein